MEDFEENGLVTADGTKVLNVEEYDKILQAIPESKRVLFEVILSLSRPAFNKVL